MTKNAGIIVLLGWLILLSACSTQTAVDEPDPYSSLCQSPSNHHETDPYPGLREFVPDFDLNDYQCIHISDKSIVWIPEDDDPEAYMAEVNKIDPAIDQIGEYLGTSIQEHYGDEERVHFFYGSTDIAFTPILAYHQPLIFMPSSRNRYSYTSNIHELVHVMSTIRGPGHTWMVEGLAVYVNVKLGGEDQWLRAGKEIDKWAYTFLQRDEILKEIGNQDFRITIPHLQTDFGRGYYIMSGSLVKYIFEQIGSADFMSIFKNEHLLKALNDETGKSIDEWKEEWKDYLTSEYGKR